MRGGADRLDPKGGGGGERGRVRGIGGVRGGEGGGERRGGGRSRDERWGRQIGS